MADSKKAAHDQPYVTEHVVLEVDEAASAPHLSIDMVHALERLMTNEYGRDWQEAFANSFARDALTRKAEMPLMDRIKRELLAQRMTAAVADKLATMANEQDDLDGLVDHVQAGAATERAAARDLLLSLVSAS